MWGVGVSGMPGGSTGVSSPPALYWFNYELVRTWLCRQAWLEEATFMVSFTSGAISGTVSLGHWGSFGGAWPLWERGMGLGWCWEVTTAGTGQEHQVLAHRPVSTPQVAAVLTLPFDVVKTQRQIELGDSEVHPGEGPGSRQVPGEQPGLPVGVSQPSPAPL